MPDLLDEVTEARPHPRQEAAAGVRHHSRFRKRFGRATRGIAGIVALAVIWEVAPRTAVVDPHFVPPLSEVLDAWWGLVQSGELWTHLRASLVRSGVGFGLAVLLAIPLGAAVAWYSLLRDVATPVLEIFRNTAALALLPVFVLILGIGETSKIALVVYACFFPVLLSTITGVRTVDPLLLKSARSLGLRPLQLFTKVTLPAAVPTIFTGVRMAGAASILVLV
ncbi:MAG: ABC transporter permease, partial [Aeromicrobium sp.]